MTIDTLIQTVSDKNKTITLNSVDKLVLKKSTTPDEIISENMTDDFDVYVDAKGRINIFGITKEGTFVHTENTNNIWQTHKILERKNKEGKILGVRVLCINGNFHLFYCIDYKERILVHQVVNSGEYTMSPEVIDYVGRRFLYDVCVDDDKNLHIVYVADDDYLMYRAYTYNSKSYRNRLPT